jgi:hypothetical protein
MKAQSFLEYTVLICCLVAAIVGLQIFAKRAMQGRFREAVDTIGGQYAPLQAEATVNTVNNPIQIFSSPEPVWLKYPAGTKDDDGNDISGKNICDAYGLPVLGINITTNYGENVEKTGSEKMDKFEGSLF